jgi:hypothetical protein
MSYKQMDRRLAEMEQEAAQAAERRYMTWIENLSFPDLEALVVQMDPAEQAEIEALSAAELEQLIATRRQSAREWDMDLLQMKERLAAIHASQERLNACACPKRRRRRN